MYRSGSTNRRRTDFDSNTVLRYERLEAICLRNGENGNEVLEVNAVLVPTFSTIIP
jgi:hypothetical protein